MTEEVLIDGIDVCYREGLRGYVAVFGPEYAVHFTQPTNTKWVARRPYALEPICTASTLPACVRLAKQHYDALVAERRKRTSARVAAAIEELAKLTG